jgi:hypothetical protein
MSLDSLNARTWTLGSFPSMGAAARSSHNRPEKNGTPYKDRVGGISLPGTGCSELCVDSKPTSMSLDSLNARTWTLGSITIGTHPYTPHFVVFPRRHRTKEHAICLFIGRHRRARFLLWLRALCRLQTYQHVFGFPERPNMDTWIDNNWDTKQKSSSQLNGNN